MAFLNGTKLNRIEPFVWNSTGVNAGLMNPCTGLEHYKRITVHSSHDMPIFTELPV